jgi:hypothetical protein
VENQIKFRDIPFFGWIGGLLTIAFSAYAYSTSPSFLVPQVIVPIIISLLFFTLNYALTIIADRNTRTLTLDYHSLLNHTKKEIPFEQIAGIRVDSRVSRSTSNGRTRTSTTYCIVLNLKNGEAIPFRTYYSSGSYKKQQIVDGLRNALGLAQSFDETPQGIMRELPKMGAAFAKAQQEAQTGPNAQERITNGVHWSLQSISMGVSPITRWHSPDLKTTEGFLFIAQKVAGQSSGGFMANLANTLFKQSISLYGFSSADTPNISNAEPLVNTPPLIDTHFTAFTSNQMEARQLLNAWVQNPLAEWGQNHPLKQFQSSNGVQQLVVLLSPNGLYLATLGNLNPAQVDELTTLGVELVKAQRM